MTPPDLDARARSVLVELKDRFVDPASGAECAHCAPGNPLAMTADEFGAVVRSSVGESRRVVAWSGTLAEGLFDDDPRTWGPAGHAAFNSMHASVAPMLLELDARLLLRPHARHVLNDVASTRTALRSLDGQPFGLALAPTSLLTATMLDRIEEHLERIFEGLGKEAHLLIIDDLVAMPTSEDESVLPRPVALGDGLLPRPLVLELMARHLKPGVPIVLGSASAARPSDSMEWLDR